MIVVVVMIMVVVMVVIAVVITVIIVVVGIASLIVPAGHDERRTLLLSDASGTSLSTAHGPNENRNSKEERSDYGHR